MPSGNAYERVVGRLIEVRIDEGFRSPSDVDVLVVTSKKFLDNLPPHERVIIATDWRRATILGTGTVQHVINAFARINPRVLRSAVLVMPDAATSIIQMTRVVNEARHRERQVFTASETLSAWLGEVTTPKEQARLDAFLTRSSGQFSTTASLRPLRPH
jgi:hypothetical protein